MKEKGEQEIKFTFAELKKLSNYSNRSIERLYNDWIGNPFLYNFFSDTFLKIHRC